jgi:hypothetical protein
MTLEDEIAWVTLEIELSEEQGELLKEMAQGAGMSLECLCVCALLKYLMEVASADDKEGWESRIAATLRPNGCDESREL